MPREPHGAVIELVWPEGNDEDELLIRGHVDFDVAKETLMRDSEELEGIAVDTFEDPHGVPEEEIERTMRRLLDQAEYAHVYGRWSTEPFDDNPNGVVLRVEKERGRGRFPVTQVLLSPIHRRR